MSRRNRRRFQEDESDEIWEIRYEIEPSLNYNRRKIENAMREVEKYSRIQFEPRTGRQRCYLVITKDDGCYFNGDNECYPRISLGMGCRGFGTILHELLHAIGFEHEHKRPDRNRYVKILWGNIEQEDKPQFQRVSREEYMWSDFPFDYDSIMLYESYAFTKNGLPTMVDIDGEEIPRNNRLSELDKLKLNMM